jgi:hypothetical protein
MARNTTYPLNTTLNVYDLNSQSENIDWLVELKSKTQSQVLVAHACNSTYSGGRDQEDYGLKPVQTNSLQDPISKKKLITRKAYH